MDLFEAEQQIYDNALDHINTIKNGADCDTDEFAVITKSYGKLLKQLRRLTKASDETTGSLHNKAIDLSERDHAKSRFLARMSHEIRTPISAVLGISEIQLQDPSLSLKTEEAFAKIYNSANTLLGIVNDILDLSKIEAGKMSVINEEYDVADMINDVVQLNYFYLANKNINFVIKVDEDLPTRLSGDELRIKQILNNLLSNSFKYTSEGFVEFSVQAKNCPQDGHMTLSLTIRDTGHGMTPEQLEDLHSEYSRFHEKEHRSVQGTGLGMSITFNLVQLMEASLDITSQVNEGTKLVLEIPQEISSNEVLGPETAQEIEKFEMGARPKRLNFTPEPMPYGKVLVVDDVEANLYVTKGLLAFYDIKVETCDNAHEALNKIKKGKVYDIVFMDFMMPNMNGTEAMKIMRGYGYTQPIVALTANAMIGKAEEFIREGFDSFISKPIQTKHLNTILMKYIRDRQPPEVIEAALLTRKSRPMQTDIEAYQRDAGLMKKLRTDFVRSQKNIIAEIRESANEGDIEKAHRLAHSLKGMAGLIHENALSSAAEQVERLLANRKIPPSLQMSVLDNELRRVLEDIGTSTAVELAPAKEFDKEKAAALFADLKGLLETSNVDCLNLLDELRSIPETAILVRQVENFDFAFALNSLKAIMEVYDM